MYIIRSRKEAPRLNAGDTSARMFDVRDWWDPNAGRLKQHDGNRPALSCSVVV